MARSKGKGGKASSVGNFIQSSEITGITSTDYGSGRGDNDGKVTISWTPASNVRNTPTGYNWEWPTSDGSDSTIICPSCHHSFLAGNPIYLDPYHQMPSDGTFTPDYDELQPYSGGNEIGRAHV